MSAPAGTTFTCHFYGLPPGATPVTLSYTNPNGSPVTDTVNEPIATDGSTTQYIYLTTQGNRTITVTAANATASTAVIVEPPNFGVATTQARNGFVSVQTKAGIRCAMLAYQPDGNLGASFSGAALTAISDPTGLVSFTYQPLTSPTGTWRYSIRCTSGSETITVAPTFTVP